MLPGAFVPPMRSPLPGTSTRQSHGQTFLPAHSAQVRAALLRAACVPESSRVPGGSAPAAGRICSGCQEGLLQLRPRLQRVHFCLCNLTLRWFGNVNDGCNGLRGSSRAAELRARAAPWRARGAGGWNLPRQLPQGWAG